MKIRTLLEQLTDADLDKVVYPSEWRRVKNLSDSDQPYFGLWVAKYDTNKFRRYADLIQIPENGASIRILLGNLTNAELDKEVDVAAWRLEKNLPDTEIAHLQAFICLKDGKKWTKLFDIPIPEGYDRIEAQNKSYNISKQDKTHFCYPTREDFVNAMRRFNSEEISIDDILDMMEKNMTSAGYILHNDWRSITEKKIAIWSQK